jgi:hypothetical protein
MWSAKLGLRNPGVRLPGALAARSGDTVTAWSPARPSSSSAHSRPRSSLPGPCPSVELGLSRSARRTHSARCQIPTASDRWLLVPLGSGCPSPGVGWALIAVTPVAVSPSSLPLLVRPGPVERMAGGGPGARRGSCREPVDRRARRAGPGGSGVNRRSGPLVSRRDLLQAGVVAGAGLSLGFCVRGERHATPPSDARFPQCVDQS